MEFVLLLALIVAIVFAANAVKIVPQQHAWVVERLGRYYGSLSPGLNIVLPFVDRIAYRHELKEVPLDVAPQVCITRDNTQVQIDGVLFYQITDPMRASYGTANYQMAVVQLAQTSLRSECGKRELDRLLEERNDINLAVIAALDEASPNWGVKVLRYEIRDITPPDNVLRAMQSQITAEREKRARIAQSEGKRQEEINLAEGSMTAAIRNSEGQMQAAINRAQGEAQAMLLTAQATADALRTISSALAEPGSLQAVNLRVAEQYIAAFNQVARTGNTLILPADLSGIGSMVSSALAIIKQQQDGTT